MLLRALAGPGGIGVTLFPEHSSSEICPTVDEGSPLVTSGLGLSLCLGALMNLGGFTVRRRQSGQWKRIFKGPVLLGGKCQS